MVSQLSQLPNMYFRKKIGMNHGEISMDAEMIRLLLAIDETKSIGQVAKETGMSLASIKNTLVKLIKLKLVEPVGRGVKMVTPDFLVRVREALVLAIGPIGEFLIEDIAAAMGCSALEIPTHRAAEFISLLAEEIPSEDGRLQFKKTMLAILPR
jgi:hypothetical protein